MEFWLENQGQHQLYSRFGTLPGRNCAHNYHDRHQPAYNTLCYGEQRDQGRATSDWTVPGSRAGGALQEYTNWAEPELPSSPPPHFPFILHRHNQRHQDLGEYRQHNPRDRERAPHGAVRDHDRGFLRDPWPKRWDQSHPSCYRDVPAKRNDSSYRELEAWAARYSHSLPRRRRLEAELQQAIQGLSESSWAPEREKPVTNPRVQPQHGQLNPNSRASGQWDTAAPPATDSNLMKEKTEYQSGLFGKPPGYIGPPPYNRPPVMHHRDVGWQQVGKTRADWSQPTLRKQDVAVDLQTKGEAEKEESKIYPEMEELKSSKPDGDALQTASPIDAQTPEGVLAQEPQAVQSSSTRREEICKVLEGRKFRVKKKTGGMTIFCLVSRIASPSETASLHVCTSQTSVQSTETDISEARQDSSQMKRLTDDVDLGAQTLKEQSDKTAIRCRDKVMSEDKLPSTANSIFLEESGVERSVPPSLQPVLMKYPLWREPSASSKAEADSSDTNCLKETLRSISNQNEGGDVSSRSTDNEKKKLDIMEDAEDLRGLVVIDTSCVVVKVELIPPPKKEHVHYLGSTANEESSSSESNSQLYQDVTADPSNETPSRNEDPDADLDPSLLEKPEHKESGQPSLLSERETLEERAERILGIPLQDAVAEQQTEDEEPLIDLCEEEQNEEAEKPPSEQILEDAADHVEALQAEKDKDDIRKQVTNEDDQEQQATETTEDTEPQLRTDNTSTPNEMKKDSRGESTGGEPTNEDHTVDLNNPSSLSLNSSPSSIQEGLDCEREAQSVEADLTPHPDASLPPVQPPPPSPESPQPPLSSGLSEERLPSPPPLEVMFLAADVERGAEPVEDEGETSHSAESGVNGESSVTEMNKVSPHQHNECHKSDDAPCAAEMQQTDEADSTRAETRCEELKVLAQQLRCAQTDSVTCAREEVDPQAADGNLSDPPVQTGEENEEHVGTCETKDDLEEDGLWKIESDATLEMSQTNAGLITSLLEPPPSNERDTHTQTRLQTDTLQNSPSRGDCPDYSSPSPSGSEGSNKLLIFDFSSPPQQPDTEYVPLLDADSPLNVDIAAAPHSVENVSNCFHLDSCEESSQLSTFLPQEEDVSPTSSPPAAHKKGSQYPKSLVDVVNRIRKHTAPDSESEEEEVSEQWDLSCLDVGVDKMPEENFSEELQVFLKDSAETGQEHQQDKEPEGHADGDTLSCSSRVFENAVVAAGEETRLSGEVDVEKKESDKSEGELRCSSEEKGEAESKEGEDEEELDICGCSEKCPLEVAQNASHLLN